MEYRTYSPIKPRTLASALEKARCCLDGISETPSLDSQVLLAFILQRPRSWLLAHPEYEMDAEETLQYAECLAQLTACVPLPYVIGEWEFYGLKFNLTPQVLIPRPETEQLVDTALEWLSGNPGRRSVAEIGTGSGCIAVSLAKSLPDLKLTAADISQDALQVARSNARRHEVQDRIEFVQSDLLTEVDGEFDLLCANLPYIPSETLRQLDVYLREPTLALDGGPDGLTLIGTLLTQAADRLIPGGLVLLEIESGHGISARKLAQQFFPQARIEVKPDLAGHPRLLSIQT
jgi:release factor glutamine methyltransferase